VRYHGLRRCRRLTVPGIVLNKTGTIQIVTRDKELRDLQHRHRSVITIGDGQKIERGRSWRCGSTTFRTF